MCCCPHTWRCETTVCLSWGLGSWGTTTLRVSLPGAGAQEPPGGHTAAGAAAWAPAPTLAGAPVAVRPARRLAWAGQSEAAAPQRGHSGSAAVAAVTFNKKLK